MKKQTNPMVEFGVIIFLLVAVVVFVWTADFSFSGKAGAKEKDATEEKKPAPNDSPEYAGWREGKDLFKSNCAACHNPKADGTGPALMGSVERWKGAGEYQGKTGEEWLKVWVRNWNEPVNAGYKYAIDMANSRTSQMNMFTNLSDEKIDLILSYVNNPSGPVVASK